MPITAEAIARYERASPLLLAMEASQAPPARLDTGRKAVEWNRERVHYESRLQMQRSWRFSFLQHWALISEYIDPRRSLWLSQGGVDQPVPNAMVRGLPINQAIVDPTATIAMHVCAAGLMQGLMSPS